MSTLQNFPEYSGTITKFLPAVLKENKSGWIIEYYVEHPTDSKHPMKRKQIRLTKLVKRYKSVKDARTHANRAVAILNAKLAGGWNPFFSSEDARLYEKLSTVTELFLKEKRKEKRDTTIRSYESFCRMLNEWISKHSPDLLASMFGQLYAVRYMDYMYSERNVGSTTYNNHVKMGRSLFNWMKERCYTKQNPFDLIKLKPKTEKSRVMIPRDVRVDVISDLQTNNPQLLLICKLIYNSMIRPIELRKLRIDTVNLVDRYIYIDKSIAKNKKSRNATITQDIINSFVAMNLDQYPSNYFLFAEDLQPGAVGVKDGYYSKRWSKMRDRLHLPITMKMYSFRDTGIHEMLKGGIDDLSVMQHADHASLQMTTLYGNHYDPNLNNLIYEKSPKF